MLILARFSDSADVAPKTKVKLIGVVLALEKDSSLVCRLSWLWSLVG